MDQERIYDLIYNSGGLSKGEIKKALGMKDEDPRPHLDSLYRCGFIDLERGKYKAVPEDKIFALYLERNIDLSYLRDSVDISLVESMWRKECDIKATHTKSIPAYDMDGKISELERKIRILESLHKSFMEMKRIR